MMLAVSTSLLLLSGCGGSQSTGSAAGSAASSATEQTTEIASETLAEEESAQMTETEAAKEQEGLEDGTYSAKFTTDNSMFHVNEACEDQGVLTVEGGAMTIHISLTSKNIVNLFPGMAEDAAKDGAQLLEPTVDAVTYSDGTTEEVYGFDVPVPAIGEEFNLALIGTKGKWYDHKVTVTDPVKDGVAPGYAELEEAPADSAVGEEASAAEDESQAVEVSEDQAAANTVAEMIDAIYVQERTENTDEQCKAAKEAWDALTDEQKELVEGENADPDYFGRDTGDASADDPLNADEIGENELLVVSFGTSFNDSRAEDIGGIEKALADAYPDWSVRRAFTAQIIINHVQARDGEAIDNMDQALQRAVDNGVKNLIIQPTHLMHGAEYDELSAAVEGFADQFESVKIAEPLLGEVGADASAVNEDKETVAKAVTEAAVASAGFDSLEAADADSTAFVFMGHGTSHTAKITYSQMQTQMDNLGYKNVFIGTVEGEPEETACAAVIEKVKAAGYKKVILRPLMVVAGDHANNDMAGDEEDSWKSMFTADGSFESVDCQIEGLGRIPAVQQLYVTHTKNVLEDNE